MKKIFLTLFILASIPVLHASDIDIVKAMQLSFDDHDLDCYNTALETEFKASSLVLLPYMSHKGIFKISTSGENDLNISILKEIRVNVTAPAPAPATATATAMLEIQAILSSSKQFITELEFTISQNVKSKITFLGDILNPTFKQGMKKVVLEKISCI